MKLSQLKLFTFLASVSHDFETVARNFLTIVSPPDTKEEAVTGRDQIQADLEVQVPDPLLKYRPGETPKVRLNMATNALGLR